MRGCRSADIGKSGEDVAAHYLATHDYTIIARNYRIRGGEIDIICKKADEIVFIEVKTRSRTDYGYPEQGVDFRKGRFIARAMREYVRRARVPREVYLRFDILALQWSEPLGAYEIRHIINVELPT